ncbi:N-acetyltransferase [Nonomuraea africana]|uniref:GNAT superfamily N-acetyltransferase n=1 Tax=Nonomuraea africana TaxID=46171 RepID=A0ABR9KTV1_9ACTN|nr:N-acetyltransferase [Nonomuraea africana]MBE1565464.1 GNAT superfamily N-acetyltransferase [Nonomuraea africana]
MTIRITTLAERPDLVEPLWQMTHSWPEFMLNDPVAGLYFNSDIATDFGEYLLVAVDEEGAVAARACSIPFERPEGDLPDDGWDAVVRWGAATRRRGGRADAISALDITIRDDLRGSGMSGRMLTAMRENAARLGFSELLAPVRPNQKHLEPRVPMAEYAFRTRDDGLPYDAWLRVHVRAGAKILKVAPRSMVVPGTLAEWRRWTGLPFDVSGRVEVPGALVAVHVDVDQDHAVYVEPNVWVSHPL